MISAIYARVYHLSTKNLYHAGHPRDRAHVTGRVVPAGPVDPILAPVRQIAVHGHIIVIPVRIVH